MAATNLLGYISGISFRQSGGAVTLAAPLRQMSLGSGPITLYARIRVPFSPPSAAGIVAVAALDGAPTPQSLALMMVNTSLVGMRGSNVVSASGLVAGNNVHVALVRDGSTGKLFVDGNEVASASGFGGGILEDYLLIGFYDDKPWLERIYRVSLFNRALNAQELLRLSKHGIDEGDRWGTTEDEGTPGCLIDLDLSPGVGRHFPDRSGNNLSAWVHGGGPEVIPGIIHVVQTSYGSRAVTRLFDGDEISDQEGETFLFDLPPNCGLTGVEFDTVSAFGGDTLDIGTADDATRFVSAHAPTTGLTYAESSDITSQNSEEFTPVFVRRSSPGGGIVKIRPVYEVRGLPTPAAPPPPPEPLPISVSLISNDYTLIPGQAATLTATVLNDSLSAGVTWSIISGEGGFESEGSFVASFRMPTGPTAGGFTTVRATSVTDPTKFAQVVLTQLARYIIPSATPSTLGEWALDEFDEPITVDIGGRLLPTVIARSWLSYTIFGASGPAAFEFHSTGLPSWIVLRYGYAGLVGPGWMLEIVGGDGADPSYTTQYLSADFPETDVEIKVYREAEPEIATIFPVTILASPQDLTLEVTNVSYGTPSAGFQDVTVTLKLTGTRYLDMVRAVTIRLTCPDTASGLGSGVDIDTDGIFVSDTELTIEVVRAFPTSSPDTFAVTFELQNPRHSTDVSVTEDIIIAEPFELEEINWGPITYTCGASSVGSLGWQGVATRKIYVYHNGVFDPGSIDFVATIDHLTASGGSTEPLTDGSISSVTFVEEGANPDNVPLGLPSSRRRTYEVAYIAPARPDIGFQTADLSISLTNLGSPAESAWLDSVAGSFNC